MWENASIMCICAAKEKKPLKFSCIFRKGKNKKKENKRTLLCERHGIDCTTLLIFPMSMPECHAANQSIQFSRLVSNCYVFIFGLSIIDVIFI